MPPSRYVYWARAAEPRPKVRVPYIVIQNKTDREVFEPIGRRDLKRFVLFRERLNTGVLNYF